MLLKEIKPMAEAKKKEAKKEIKKEVKGFWKITSDGWSKPILTSKKEATDRYLKKMKAKGYKVEEA